MLGILRSFNSKTLPSNPKLTAPWFESNLDALVELYAGLKRMICSMALGVDDANMWKQMLLSPTSKMACGTRHSICTRQPKSKPVPVLSHSPRGVHAMGRPLGSMRQKLQQWEILQDFAKHENFQDLL